MENKWSGECASRDRHVFTSVFFNGLNLFLSFHISLYRPRGRSNPHGTSGAPSLLWSFLEFPCYVRSKSSHSFSISSLLRILFDEVHLLACSFSFREIALMKLLHHPNVCELLDVEFNDDKGYLYWLRTSTEIALLCGYSTSIQFDEISVSLYKFGCCLYYTLKIVIDLVTWTISIFCSFRELVFYSLSN